MFAKFNIKYENVKFQKDRLEMFNLKNAECQSVFSEVTENNAQLQKCFQGGKTFPNECNNFFKSFDDILHRCFRKIRVTKIKDESDVQELLDQKLKLQQNLDLNSCNIADMDRNYFFSLQTKMQIFKQPSYLLRVYII